MAASHSGSGFKELEARFQSFKKIIEKIAQ